MVTLYAVALVTCYVAKGLQAFSKRRLEISPGYPLLILIAAKEGASPSP